MPQPLSTTIRLFVTGLTMGIADLIPGVSGGTIAFLSGIYEELLVSIRTVSGETLKLLARGQVAAAIQSVPWSFLLPLVLGIGLSIFSLANVLSWLLQNHPVFVWAFFFGLVLASVFIVLKRVVRWDVSDKVGFIVATIATYFLVGAVPVATPTNVPFIFLSGAIAICAMILPGISGSFILVLLGKYEYILSAVVARDFITLAVFTAGCAIGLAIFARFLSWLFARHHDISVAVLAGIMLGSIRKIWPWQEAGRNSMPPVFDGTLVAAIALALAGMALVYFLDRLKVVKERTEDINSAEFSRQHQESLVREERPNQQ